jgi:tetratricopeptide (TPR) repeat protein
MRKVIGGVIILAIGGFLAVGRIAVRRSPSRAAADPCPLALAPHAGEGKLDREIARAQGEARAGGPGSARAMERLGWLFVGKARSTFDSGYYKLAEQCADCIQSRTPQSPEALLLRGHVLDNLHRFKEAEIVARRLVELRGSPFDHGLLGDALMEQGRLAEAAGAYQKMLDLRPGLQSYSRAAHLRWLKGDLKGALQLERMAASAGSPRDSESLAWAYTRLAHYELVAGDLAAAERASSTALDFEPGYAPALLERGRILLARGESQSAADTLARAAAANPTPEYQWILAEALSAAGRAAEAQAVERELTARGAAADPRTYSLFLATRKLEPETALRLSREELAARADVFTLDAAAWANAAAGRLDEARAGIERALAEGTRDARLFLHAGVIARAAGRQDEARRWLEQAAALGQTLLPSEREELRRQLSAS